MIAKIRYFTNIRLTNLSTKKAVDVFLNRKKCVHKSNKIDNIKCCKKINYEKISKNVILKKI